MICNITSDGDIQTYLKEWELDIDIQANLT